MSEIIFEVKEDEVDGGFVAEALASVTLDPLNGHALQRMDATSRCSIATLMKRWTHQRLSAYPELQTKSQPNPNTDDHFQHLS